MVTNIVVVQIFIEYLVGLSKLLVGLVCRAEDVIVGWESVA